MTWYRVTLVSKHHGAWKDYWFQAETPWGALSQAYADWLANWSMTVQLRGVRVREEAPPGSPEPTGWQKAKALRKDGE